MTNNSVSKGIILLIILILSFCIPLFFSFATAESMLDVGYIVNSKMKSLAANADISPWDETSDIKAIHIADSLPVDFLPSEINTISTSDSDYPIYIFFDNQDRAGIVYLFTESDVIVMNPDSSSIFACNSSLTDISGIANWDASNVVSLSGAFMRDSSLSDLSPLANWDIHNVVWLAQTFLNNSSINDISPLANWNTSNVTDLHGLFCGANSLHDALALRKWDTSNVVDMSYMFSGATSLEYIDVSTWNTSNVTTMSSMFSVGESWAGNGCLCEIIGLNNLNVSNVTDMTCMFYGAGKMTFYDIANWDVSKVESMNHMFCDNFSLRSLDLSMWDVSSVKTMYCMFDDNYKLKTIGDVSHWNTVSLIDVGGWLNGASSFIGDNQGTLDLSCWNTSNLKTAAEMFRATQIRTIDLSGWTFDSITNDSWDGAGRGIYYETGNSTESYRGMGIMFNDTTKLKKVFVSQAGLDSYNKAVERGVSTLNMWVGSKATGFTVK